ncbi:MAG: N-acetylneuraminate synthase [bacterium]|nr:N-acetylneuraminate synthase [bacterium]
MPEIVMKIEGKTISEDLPCFIIAEAGLNHNGDPEVAAKLIETAADCGADAVKFQTYLAEELFAPDHPEFDTFKRMQFGHETYRSLQTLAARRGVILLSTPFDEASLNLLDELGLPAFKVGSGEVTHLDFLRNVASKGKPVILSTGMAGLDQVDAAVAVLREHASAPFALMHCVSSYPCPLENARVRNISVLRERYGGLAGYSDHTTTDEAALAAVALGACVVEKHFTLSKFLPGWDHSFSYDPGELKRLIQAIRRLESTLGGGTRTVQAPEKPIEAIARRSLYARRACRAGDELTRDDVLIRRPLGPIEADRLDEFLHRRLVRDVPTQAAFKPDDFE